MKRGQATLFIILGIIIVSIIALGVYFRESIVQETSELQLAERATVAPQVQEIYDHVFDCIDETAKSALTTLGLQGGYLEPQEDAIELEEEGIAISLGYDQGENKLAPVETMQEELEQYTNAFVPTCTNLELFEGFSFEETIPTTKVELQDNAVIFTVSYPITAKLGEDNYNLNKPYKFSYLVRLKHLQELSNQIISEEISDPNELNLNYLLDLGVDIEVLSYEEGQIVYLLTDSESQVDELPYIFMFANRFEQ